MGGNELRKLIVKDVARGMITQRGQKFDLAPVSIQLAGRITVASANIVVDDRLLYGRHARLAFALLVIERDRPVHRDELAAALWSDGLPRSWNAVLRGVVSKVRGFLTAAGLPGNAALNVGFGTYQLQLPVDVQVDVECARLTLETAERILHQGDPQRAIALAESARAITVRPFLPDAKGLWVTGVRDRLREVQLWALGVLSEAYAQRGRYQLARRTAEDAIALEPFRERTYQLLMRVHASAGNPAEALRVYHRCRRLLADELGIDPAAETVALHLALLRNESWSTDVRR